MNREKIIGTLMAIVIVTILSWIWSNQGTIPLLSAAIFILMLTNMIFAFVSIFIQKAVILLYEMNVEEKSTNSFSYAFEYLAIFGSGLNYHVQNACNRLPFLFNKLFSILFCLCLFGNMVLILMIYIGGGG